MDDVQTFYSLLRIPQRPSQEAVELLAELQEKYPYFQGVQLLVAANADAIYPAQQEQKRAEAVLSLPDSFALFRYLDALRLYQLRQQHEEVQTIDPLSQVSEIESESQIEHLQQKDSLSNQGEETQTQLPSLAPRVSVTAAVASLAGLSPEIDLSGVLPNSIEEVAPFPIAPIYTLEYDTEYNIEELYHFTVTVLNPYYTPPEPVAADENEEEPHQWHPISAEQQMDLINNFLKNLDGENGIKATVLRKAEAAQREGERIEDLGSASTHVTNTSSMERIAQLYETRGNFNKAIEVYEQLVHDFPKKSAYFASEIERLRALDDPRLNS